MAEYPPEDADVQVVKDVNAEYRLNEAQQNGEVMDLTLSDGSGDGDDGRANSSAWQRENLRAAKFRKSAPGIRVVSCR